MKKNFFLLSVLLIGFTLVACSPIDSLRPFDQEQAAVLVNNMKGKC